MPICNLSRTASSKSNQAKPCFRPAFYSGFRTNHHHPRRASFNMPEQIKALSIISFSKKRVTERKAIEALFRITLRNLRKNTSGNAPSIGGRVRFDRFSSSVQRFCGGWRRYGQGFVPLSSGACGTTHPYRPYLTRSRRISAITPSRMSAGRRSASATSLR